MTACLQERGSVRGIDWKPIFDEGGSYSLGHVAVDPRDPDVVWLGTGENISNRSVGYGDGVYKSKDGGETWTNVGLRDSQHIGKIIVDPHDSRIVYVAAEGPLWSSGGERSPRSHRPPIGSHRAAPRLGTGARRLAAIHTLFRCHGNRRCWCCLGA